MATSGPIATAPPATVAADLQVGASGTYTSMARTSTGAARPITRGAMMP